MPTELDTIESLSIVMLGNFNPTIFQPYWFSSKGLIRENESSNAKIQVIHSSVVQFELDWVSFLITKDKFQAITTRESYFELVKDLVISTFKILSETPIDALGINHTYNFTLKNQKNYTKFGEWLGNLSLWQESVPEAKLLTLEIFHEKKENGELGSQKIRITPSDLPNLNFGVAIDFNEHIQLKPSANSNKELLLMLEKNWKPSSIESKKVISKLWKKFQQIL